MIHSVSSSKLQMTSSKLQVTSDKLQVTSSKFSSADKKFAVRDRSINFLGLVLLAGSMFLISAKETGCGKAPDFNELRPASEQRSADFLQKKLRNYEHKNLKQMNAQAKVFMEGNGQSIGATANIIWVRDSIIWLNVKKFGLEAARVLITQDSVFVLNRLEKTYSARGLESLQRQYSLPAGFELVQSLLMASPWFFPDIRLESDIKDGLHRLSGANGRFSTDYRMEDEAYWLKQEHFLQPRDTRTMSASFENYKKTEIAGWFPYLRTLEASSLETGDMRLSIELNDVEFNVPKAIRFEIPKHYDKIE